MNKRRVVMKKILILLILFLFCITRFTIINDKAIQAALEDVN